VQIGEFDLVQEATSIVDEWLLKEVNLAAKLPTTKVDFHASKDIEFVKRLASPEGAGGSVLKGTETFPTSPAHSEHSVEGPTSLQLVAKTISIVVENISHEVMKEKSTAAVVSGNYF